MEKNQAYTLSEFSVTVQDEQIRETIKNYTVDGAMGHLLDAKTDGLRLSDFTVFEIEELMNLGDRYALPVLLYLFRRIERSLQGQPAAILLDEAWLMLGHPVFREKIREWLKVLRRANCFVLMATQSLTDAANSGIFDVIVVITLANSEHELFPLLHLRFIFLPAMVVLLVTFIIFYPAVIIRRILIIVALIVLLLLLRC